MGRSSWEDVVRRAFPEDLRRDLGKLHGPINNRETKFLPISGFPSMLSDLSLQTYVEGEGRDGVTRKQTVGLRGLRRRDRLLGQKSKCSTVTCWALGVGC